MEPTTKSYIKASFWDRVFAAIIDQFIVGACGQVLALGLFGLFYLLNITAATSYLFLTGILLGITYNVGFVHKKGATIGKMALKLRVVTQTYEQPSLKTIFLRETIGKWISMLGFGLGSLWVLIDKNRQAWHDKIAHTYIVKLNHETHDLIPGDDLPVTKGSRALFGLFVFGTIAQFLLVLAVLTFLFVASPYRLTDQIMSPAVPADAYIVINKISYKFTAPARGDAIMFRSPADPGREIFRRIVGLPNEKIMIQNGKVYINDQLLAEPYLPNPTWTEVREFMTEGEPITIPADNYFVMGDNREKSPDSRQWGFVPRSSVIGSYWFRYQ